MTPFPRYRVWHDAQMLPVHSLSWNQAGCLFHGPGHHVGWAQVNNDFNWTDDNPKPEVSHVMATTGLKDKNGAEIWEGDIVRYTRRGGIVGDNGIYVASVKWQGFGFALVRPDRDDYPDMLADDWRIMSREVIGNVYQNPDLLKRE